VISQRLRETLLRGYAEIIVPMCLRGGVFELTPPDDQGIYRSEVFPGLWLNVDAALRRDGVETMKTLGLGLASDEHRSFVVRLHC